MKKQIQILFKYLFMCALVTFSSVSFSSAEEFQFQAKNYTEASKQSTYLRFDMASTKFGLVTTNFTGFVKQFVVTANPGVGKLTDAKISFKVESMDTDVDGRNVKMWETCFDYKKHNEIIVELGSEVIFSEAAQEIPAMIQVRGKKHNITVKLMVQKSDEKYTVNLESTVSLKGLEIPDPSILIASVRDTVDLKAHFEIPIPVK